MIDTVIAYVLVAAAGGWIAWSFGLNRIWSARLARRGPAKPAGQGCGDNCSCGS